MTAQPGSDSSHPAPSSGSLSEAFTAAAQRTPFAELAPGEEPSAGVLLGAIGGVRGILESMLPGLAFLILFSVTRQVPVSVLVPAIIAIVFVVIRVITRTPLTQAIAGAIGIAFSAVLALITGRASDNFLPGIFINAGALVLFVGSIVARWPLVGVLIGFILGDGIEWRQDAVKRRALTIATWVWIAPFAIRLAIEVPLYLANNATALVATKLLAGVPLYLGSLWVTWLLVKAAYPRIGGVHSEDTVERP